MESRKTRSGGWAKLAAWAAAFAPGLWLLGLALTGGLGARPVKAAIELTGDWSLYLLLVTLAVSPARAIFAAPSLLLGRRILGVAAFAYAALHLALYALDQGHDLGHVAREIVLRPYLAVGAIALVGLLALAATSWDGAVRRLGGARWVQLHSLIFPSALLSAVHFLLRSPTDTFGPMLVAGLLGWHMGCRVLQRRGEVGTGGFLALAVAAGALTALAEICWHVAATGVDPWRMLRAQVDIALGLRPAWWVLLVGLAACAANATQRATARMSASSAASGAMRGQSPS